MSAVSFDTHKLSAAGQDASASQDLATKTDLRREAEQLRHEMGLMRKEFEKRFTLLHWMLGVVAAGVATLVAKSFF